MPDTSRHNADTGLTNLDFDFSQTAQRETIELQTELRQTRQQTADNEEIQQDEQMDGVFVYHDNHLHGHYSRQ